MRRVVTSVAACDRSVAWTCADHNGSSPDPARSRCGTIPAPRGSSAPIGACASSTGGVVIADTPRRWRVLETSQPPAYYLPPDDVATEHLRPVGARGRSASGRAAASYFDWSSATAGRPRRGVDLPGTEPPRSPRSATTCVLPAAVGRVLRRRRARRRPTTGTSTAAGSAPGSSARSRADPARSAGDAAQAFLGSSENGTVLSSFGSLGSPSTRSPMMLRWIWSVPP